MAGGIFLGTKFHSSQTYVEWYLYSNYPVHNPPKKKYYEKSGYLNDNYNCMKETPHDMTTPLL
jgi:hypothetical protein